VNGPAAARVAGAGPGRASGLDERAIGAAAVDALREELATEPKPGLVTPHDPGAHADMDAATFERSLRALAGFFREAAAAGAALAPFPALRALGQAAEARMLRATGGVNTHRGALFSLGLLAAAAGRLAARGGGFSPPALGTTVRAAFGADVRALLPAPASHGAAALRAHGVGGAREEAARGFPHVFEVGLPALDASVRRGASRQDAAVQCLFALIASLPDTNLLHRGGPAGLALARDGARAFLLAGGVHRPGWRAHAREIHRALVARNLSPGGSADLLAATLMVARLREAAGGSPA
jgi:triphosphoribosyl-dephospho-CoA synthase